MQSIRDNNLKEWELAAFFDDKLQYRRLFPKHIASAITRIVHGNRGGFYNAIVGWFIMGFNGGYERGRGHVRAVSATDMAKNPV